MVKLGPKPSRAASRRNRRADNAWKVPIHRPRGSAPSSRATRARISPAALFVNVTAKMRDGATPRSRMRCAIRAVRRSEEHTSELQSRGHLVCRLLLEKKKKKKKHKAKERIQQNTCQ